MGAGAGEGVCVCVLLFGPGQVFTHLLVRRGFRCRAVRMLLFWLLVREGVLFLLFVPVGACQQKAAPRHQQQQTHPRTNSKKTYARTNSNKIRLWMPVGAFCFAAGALFCVACWTGRSVSCWLARASAAGHNSERAHAAEQNQKRSVTPALSSGCY